MKTKILFIITTILSASTIFAQSNTEDEGVIINGVKWATRNVDMPGTFAETPESAGKFYQWNRKVAWNSDYYPRVEELYAGRIKLQKEKVEGWDNSISKGIIWDKNNDPSPVGWRVPAFDEINSLLDEKRVSSEWTVQNGMNGTMFIDKESGNRLFFPAVGNRSRDTGALSEIGDIGRYWTTLGLGEAGAYGLIFSSVGVDRTDTYRQFGFPIRPVAE